MRIRPKTLLVLVIILAGLIFRLAGIKHGLPGIYHPDEPIAVSRAANAVINGDLNPHFFHWPSLLIYILAIEYEIIYMLGKISGSFKNSEDLFRFYVLNPGFFHLWGRVLIACMSSATGYFFYLTGRNWRDENAGVWALAIASFTPLLVKHGQFITPDVPALFFTSITIFFLSKYYFISNNLKYVFAASVFAGLATATKYNYALVIIPILIILCFTKKTSIKSAVISSIGVLATFVGVFLLCNPFIILDFKEFSFQLNEISMHLKEGHIGMESRMHPMIELMRHLYTGTGLFVFLSALAGIVFTNKTNRLWIITLLSFPFLIWILHASWTVTADRYSIPLLIWVIPFASVLLNEISVKLQKNRLFTAFLVVLIFAQPVYGCFRINSENIKPDTREIARKWINANIAQGSTLGIEKDGPSLKTQHIESKYYNQPAYYFFVITPWYGSHFRNEESPVEMLVKNKPQYVIINSGVYSRYQPGSPSESQFPDVYKIWRNYYDTLNKIGEVVYEVSPDKSSVGPIVKIFKIPDDIYENIVPIPSEVTDEN